MKAKVSLVLGVLMLCLCSIVCVSSPAQAKEYDYTEYGFENFKPKDKSWENKKFITKCKLDGKSLISSNYSQGEFICTLDEYLLIGYCKVKVNGTSNTETLLSCSTDNYGSGIWTNEESFESVMSKASSEASTGYGSWVLCTNFKGADEFSVIDSYLLVFKKDAKSIDDLLYVMDMKDAKKHVLADKDAYYLKGKGKYKIKSNKYDEETRTLKLSIKCNLPLMYRKGADSNYSSIPNIEKVTKVKGKGNLYYYTYDANNDILNVEIKNPKNGNYTFKLKTDKTGVNTKFTIKVKGL